MCDVLSIKEFAEKVKEGLASYLPEEFRDVEMEIVEIPENNGTVRTGLLLKKPEAKIEPILNLNVLYRKYQSTECDMEKIFDVAAKAYVSEVEKHRDFVAMYENAGKILSSFERAKTGIIFTLVYAEKNAELLKECPHRIIADMAVIYKLLLHGAENVLGTITIKNEHLNQFGVDEETLYSLAQVNTPSLLPFHFVPSDDVIAKLATVSFGEDSEEVKEILNDGCSGTLILTNRECMEGASVILYPGLLKSLEGMFGKLYIIPSSTEEVMLFPACYMENDFDGWKDLVRRTNDNLVDADKVLSYHIFRVSQDGLIEAV